MRIALISCEFAGTLSRGGIGTYMRNLADMLVSRGHDVEVFCGGETDSSETRSDGLQIHCVRIDHRGAFADAVTSTFIERHQSAPFDVAEGPEFLAETSGIRAAAPDLPLVLKLHTPSALVSAIDHTFIPARQKARFMIGGLLRGKISTPYWVHRLETDYELRNLRTANEVTSPCRAMVTALEALWHINGDDVRIVPNVFSAPQTLLDIKADTHTNVVSFVGRLELRKGIFDLAAAIPEVLNRVPEARFRLLGRSMLHPAVGRDIGEMLQDRLRGYWSRVEWIPGLPYDDLLKQYALTDICVFPSIWENFPNVCLESMAAARGVIGSSAGGMSEIIEHGRTGCLVPPRAPRQLAHAITDLLKHPERRIDMGLAARAHVTSAYNDATIAPLQEASYVRAISHAQSLSSGA